MSTKIVCREIQSALERVEKLFAEREGHHSLLFKTFIPFSTRHLTDTCKSLFPFTGTGREYLTDFSGMQKFIGSLAIGTAALIADLTTIVFRLIALIPRAIYQHYFQKNLPIEGVELSPKDAHFNWGKGTVIVYTYARGMSDENHLYVSKLAPPSFYLGSFINSDKNSEKMSELRPNFPWTGSGRFLL